MEIRHRLTRGVKRWFILSGVFFISFLETGTVRSFGVILNDMTSDFSTSTAYIGTIIGMAHGATYWLSVLNTPLLRRFSVRQVVMAGGLLGSIGLILSAFAMTGPYFAAALFMFGIGFSTVVLPANSSPVDYFPDLFEIASSISLTGGGIGLMILPLLFEVFVKHYGWRGALMLLGAINLNTLVSGVLLEPVPKAKEVAPEEVPLENTVDSTRGDGENKHCLQGNDERRLTELNGALSLDIDSQGETEELLPHQRHTDNGHIQPSENTNTNCKSDSKVLIHRMSNSEEATTNGLTSFASEVENSNRKHHHELVATFNPTSNSVSLKEINAAEDCTQDTTNRSCRCCHSIAELFDLYLFKDYPVFFGICLATILFGVSYDGWVLFVIPNAEAKGFDSQMSVYVATAGGVGNIFGRFCIGFFTAKKLIPNEVAYLIMNVLSSIAFFVNYGTTSFWFLSILSFVNGFSLGAKTSLQFIIVNGAVATDRYKAAVSMLLVSLGIGFPISGALLGGIYDRTKSYNISFCVIGFIDVICGILITAPLITAACRRRRRRASLSTVKVPV